ncbi:type 4 pilus major pilin [Erwinia pyrifoliae]|uniref:Prepilin n=2 Tax=Erwinia pyrifoliae TaxID=79967 RepID=A0ABY5X7B0_ERWPY|nr:type 4 pilus major pilin [Erwinia pyrifoliae]AUX71435.1 prepilin [Erwinia pyrifoliae]MCA8874836.1 prepilin [Erwinia pyrifoliae]MCT2387503.1 prepilin [Erwinia pyrifoliae]MCU8585758.1 prepilin [Erwinia pyrifoliae]UWS28949.1 prepilin [Erwinia pyrifoliae]
MKIKNKNVKNNIDSGAISLFEAGIWITISLIVLVIGISIGGGLFSRNDTNTELSNISELMNNSRTLLKTNGTYNFEGGESMIGALIQFGGVPGNMSIIGDKSSGKAHLQNVWGGAVSVEPAADSAGELTGFHLIYQMVPQEACIAIAQRLSTTSFVHAIRINDTINRGSISAGNLGGQCVADSGEHKGNILSFISDN